MSEVKLPEGWVKTNLGSILEFKYGKSLPQKIRNGGRYSVYGSNGVVGKHSQPLTDTCGLIVGRKGSYGEVNISQEPFFPIDTTYFIDELYEQPIKYWFYQLKHLPLTTLNRSTAIPGLNREDAYKQMIYLPSIKEQKIIAEKLDVLLAQVDSIKARLDQIPLILKKFRQSALTAAVSGKLTEDWHNNINHSKELKIKDLIDSLDQGWSPKCENTPALNKEWGVIKTSSIQPCYFVANENKKLPHNLAPRKNLTIKKGDILITRAGPRSRCGITCIVKHDHNKLLICDKVYRLRTKKNIIISQFLNWCLNSPNYLLDIENIKTGSSESGMNMTQEKLLSLKISTPPLEEQTEIVRRVEQLFAYADGVEKQVNNALERVNNLTQSILTKAFRGELTKQWRNENPDLISGENSAEALLARIKAERAAQQPQKKTRKKA